MSLRKVTGYLKVMLLDDAVYELVISGNIISTDTAYLPCEIRNSPSLCSAFQLLRICVRCILTHEQHQAVHLYYP